MDRSLRHTLFGLIAAIVLLSPWLFGAREAWWFWPFIVLLALAVIVQGLRLLLGGIAGGAGFDGRGQPGASRTRSAWLLAGFVPFLGYYGCRAYCVPVRMEGEWALLLMVTPVVLGTLIVFGLRARDRKLLFLLLAANLFCLALYGIINHAITGSSRVLWAEGYEKYYLDNRASGSLFCPDHYAGLLEIAFAMAAAALLSRHASRASRVAALALVLVSVAGILLSRSRGGGLTLAVLGVAILAWGFASWPRRARPWLRLSGASAAIVGIVLVSHFATGYGQRFVGFFGAKEVSRLAIAEAMPEMKQKVMRMGRGRMYAAAWRAWKEAPVYGIGPGMHKIEWPHIAPSADGNRALGVWPSLPNNTFYSYAVHSDWLQLLEEAGIVGFTLFLIPLGVGLSLLLGALPRVSHAGERSRRHGKWITDDGMVLGALLAAVALSFHSLGDFNLQIPGVNWVLAALVAIGIGAGDEAGTGV